MEQIQSVAVLNNDLMDLQLAIEKKINDYYQSALTKKVYATATILDPRFKAAFLKVEKILSL